MKEKIIHSHGINKSRAKILHILNISLPILAGYSIRSHFILKYQRNFVNPLALTIPDVMRKNTPDIIDKIVYYRYPPDLGFKLLVKPKVSRSIRLSNFYNWYYCNVLKTPTNYLHKIIETQNIEIIHAHSIGIFSKYVEKIVQRNNLPYIYEVRGFIEDTLVGLGVLKEGSRIYLKRQRRVIELIDKADIIITLGEMMKNELIHQGIQENKIKIVPNGVDTDYFQPIPKNMILKEQMGINTDLIIGYIGSVRKIEGIEVLIKAMKILEKKKINASLLIVGGYNLGYYKELKLLSKRLGIEKKVKFIGSVPHKQIRDYYSIIDIIVIPRINIRVNRLVTPLKPLEAMAMEKVIIVSDLPALRELVKANVSGDLFEPGNYEELANKLIYYFLDSHSREDLGRRAREFVENNFAWHSIIRRYISIYKSLLN